MKKKILQNVFIKPFSVLAALALVVSASGFALGATPSAYAATAPTTNAATSVTSTNATLNGTNGDTDATGSSFWVSTSTFSTASQTLPAGVYSTPDLGPRASSTAYSAALSSVTGLPPVTPGTTYYYAAWTAVGGAWSPGAVMQVTTVSSPTVTSISPASGSSSGGTSIVIMGTQFAPGAMVTIGGTPATSVVVASSTSITVTTPSGIVGAHNVVVTNTDGGTVTSTGGYTYTTPVVNPAAVTTVTATAVTASDATLHALNGASDAQGHSFWVSTSTFSTASATIPSGVYSTIDLGAIASATPFSASLTSATGLPAVTASTTYYYAAWVNVGGTWFPGSILHFTTASSSVVSVPTVSSVSPATGTTAGGTSVTITGTGLTGATAVHFGTTLAAITATTSATSITVTSPATTTAGIVDVTVTTPTGTSATSSADHFAYQIGGTVGGGTQPGGILAVTSITPVKTSATADGTYANGWSYLFNIVVPTTETNLSMEFANWFDTASDTMPVAGNMQISSAQASDPAPVTITAANMFSSPALHMVGNMSTSTPGLHVQVLVEVKVPLNTVNGSYTTMYGVQTQP